MSPRQWARGDLRERDAAQPRNEDRNPRQRSGYAWQRTDRWIGVSLGFI
jgi:hypothetical protein